MMKIAYFDCHNGAAGDMLTASLLSAGGDLDSLKSTLSLLNLENYSIRSESVARHGLSATQFCVDVQQGEQPHRHLSHILSILNSGGLSESVRSRAEEVFQVLGRAEAKVHGCTIEQVHFHEVGAVDAIVDIVSMVTLLDQLGIDQVICSPVPVGSGTITCDHGVLPVPAPATAELLKGIPIAISEEKGELVTPTGAALLSVLASEYGPLPPMVVDSIGYGAGSREGVTRPNILRTFIGETRAPGTADEVLVLECDVDDTTGEVIAYCCEQLFNQGALDVVCLPIYGKKSRPGTMIRAIAHPKDAVLIESILFKEVPTFGVRRYPVQRSKLLRSHETIDTPWGVVRIKVGMQGHEICTASPEYEDCKAIAQQADIPVREVMDVARKLWSDKSRTK